MVWTDASGVASGEVLEDPRVVLLNRQAGCDYFVLEEVSWLRP